MWGHNKVTSWKQKASLHQTPSPLAPWVWISHPPAPWETNSNVYKPHSLRQRSTMGTETALKMQSPSWITYQEGFISDNKYPDTQSRDTQGDKMPQDHGGRRRQTVTSELPQARRTSKVSPTDFGGSKAPLTPWFQTFGLKSRGRICCCYFKPPTKFVVIVRGSRNK